MISIYSDATTVDGHAVCTTFIISDTTYIGVVTRNYNDVYGSIHGELLAILQGLEYVSKNCDEDHDIYIFTDNREAIYHIQSPKKFKHFETLLHDINSYLQSYNVTFCYIEGHSTSHNPNKVTDLLARRVNTIVYNQEVTPCLQN